MTTESERSRAFDELRAYEDGLERYSLIVEEVALYVNQFGAETSGPNFIALHDGIKRKIGATHNLCDELFDLIILADRAAEIRAGNVDLGWKTSHPLYPECEAVALEANEEEVRKCIAHIK